MLAVSIVVQRFTSVPLGAGGGLRSLIVALPENLFIVFFNKVISIFSPTCLACDSQDEMHAVTFH